MTRKILLAHSTIEILAGIILILKPSILLNNINTEPSTPAIAKLYGIIATVLGLLSFQIWKQFSYSSFDKICILTLMAFHVMVGLHMNALYQAQLTDTIGGTVLHLAIATLFAIAYIKESPNFIE
jgi:hypothetical protein